MKFWRTSRIVRWLIIIASIAAVLFAWGEWSRHHARSQIEAELHAQFLETTQCKGPINGDICQHEPERGRCLDGRYIDYRTVWKRVTSREQAHELLQDKLIELESARRLANWLACQGLDPIYDYRISWGLEGHTYIAFSVKWKDGFSLFTFTRAVFPYRFFVEPEFAFMMVPIKDLTIARIGAQSRHVFEK